MVKQERAATKIQKCLRDYVARNKMLLKLLQCFNTCYRNKSPEQKHLFTVCRLLLSKHGKDAQVNWLTNGSADHIFTLGNSLLINIKYLTKLPSLTTSSNYTLPIRVLEELFNILIGTCSSTKISLYSKQLYFSIEWICRHLSKHHYFNHLAYFMDQQLPTTTGGYLKDFTTQSQVFDPVEFFKLPKTRSFINLIIAPLKCTFNLSDNGSPFSNPMVDFYRELVFTALNDILISTIDDHNTYIIGERVILSVDLLHLFVTVAIPGMLVKCDPTTTTSSSTVHTTESSMIQDTDDDDNHEEAVTEEEGGDESLPVLLATESYTHYTWSGSPLEAAITIRFVARILMSCLTEPHLPIVRPITDPKPLQLRIGQGEELSDDDDGDDDDNKINDNHNRMKGVEINDQEMNMSAEFTRSTNNCSLISEAVSFQPASQLTKISASLSHSLPALAASSLSTLENFNSDLDNPDKLELIRSSSYLHYCLSQVCGLSRTSLIRINSIYSQYTIYLRCLWKLIESTKCLNKSTLNYSNSNMSTLFNILCSGELPTHLVELQSYLPLIFTFADCLHHRLLCLTDSEICDISSEVNYTNSNDYRHQQPINNNIGARLRDLMLGLIDLSHPDQVPKQTRCNLQTDTHCVESMEQPNYGAVLRRIEQWVEIADLGSSPIGDLMMRNYTQWSIPDFRLLLYCWCSLLRRVERLVFQIYDWDRRCRRQQDTSLPIYLLQNPQSTTTTASTNASSTFSSSSSSTDIARVTNSPRLPLGTPSLSQTFWLKDNLFDLLNTTESQTSWFENQGYQSTLALAGAPFGYYSILNPDRNQVVLESFSLSNRQIRQVLLLKKFHLLYHLKNELNEYFFILYVKGRTPLHIAVVHSQRVVIRALVDDFKADPTLMDFSGYFPYMLLENNLKTEYEPFLTHGRLQRIRTALKVFRTSNVSHDSSNITKDNSSKKGVVHTDHSMVDFKRPVMLPVVSRRLENFKRPTTIQQQNHLNRTSTLKPINQNAEYSLRRPSVFEGILKSAAEAAQHWNHHNNNCNNDHTSSVKLSSESNEEQVNMIILTSVNLLTLVLLLRQRQNQHQQ
ncbi:unnamed protein product [Schistosoma mattheei]|uniref:ANK_REP_REGION domain-containing protein n=1 Tax=Schistosoma mattheei TaxID=31246 RepID=A0AA85BWI3_9TREM|nr:unnamed protein product [Schistosoma mattheei]